MNKLLESEINLLPTNPGCYLMYDVNNTIIYVGKAKNLKNRVSQYFKLNHSGKTGAMVSHVDHFETIITSSEKEALILEINLIQKHMPRYNIMLKDNKRYPYIAIHNVKDPYVSIARTLKDKKCDYFGPFPASFNAYKIIEVINRFFPLRKCKTVGKESCLYYQLGQCIGPCINSVKPEKYQEIINDIKHFLNGDNKKLIEILKSKIKYYSDELDFENAKECKEILDSILYLNDKQQMENTPYKNLDIMSFFERNGYLSFSILVIRNYKVIEKNNFVYEIVGNIEDQIMDIIIQYYNSNIVPKDIAINNRNISKLIHDYYGVNCISPSRGKILNLMQICQLNAKEALDNYFTTSIANNDTIELIEELGKILKIKTPYHIELFDNSHLQGSDAVGAMVCFINGEPCKKLYRKFNIESLNKKDDLSSMKEVISRRIDRLIETHDILPDMFLIDGSIEQVKIAKKIVDNRKVKINVFGLAKDENHKTNKLVDFKGNSFVIENKNLFFLLTRMQDEVHRFAISSHIKKRSKSMIKGIFDDIEGLGPRRIELIYKTYKTLDELKEANINDLLQFLPENVAYLVYDRIQSIK